MIKELKKQLYMRWDELLALYGLEAAAFAVGEAMLAVVMHFNRIQEKELPRAGTLLALAVCSGMLLFSSMLVLGVCFNQGVGMCTTRRRFVPMIFLLTYLECLLAAGFAYLLYHLEHWIFQTFYKGYTFQNVSVQWRYVLAACLILVAFQAVFGMLFLKFGQAAFWIAWGIWMLVLFGSTRIAHLADQYKDAAVLSAAGRLFASEGAVLAAVGGACAAAILVSYRILCRQQVSA